MTTLALNKQFKPTLAQALVLFKQVDARKQPVPARTVEADAYYTVVGNAPAAPVSKTIA